MVIDGKPLIFLLNVCAFQGRLYPRIAQRDRTRSEPVEKNASLMGKNENVPNKEVYDEQYRRCVGENPGLFALGPLNAILVRGVTPNKKPHC
jgi:hypothetical protein